MASLTPLEILQWHQAELREGGGSCRGTARLKIAPSKRIGDSYEAQGNFRTQ